mmetsp:Transcript_34398/g.25475  ORF Transcript_34398/g.25475 Transcript_34398/m.25475 type:complete len:106 (-) Transcript_34398:284-601(-)
MYDIVLSCERECPQYLLYNRCSILFFEMYSLVTQVNDSLVYSAAFKVLCDDVEVVVVLQQFENPRYVGVPGTLQEVELQIHHLQKDLVRRYLRLLDDLDHAAHLC